MTIDKREKQQQFSDDDILLTASSLFPPHQLSTGNTDEPGILLELDINFPQGSFKYPTNNSFMLILEYSLRYSSMPSCQTNVRNEIGLVNEPRDAFTATYLLRRLNSKYF